MTVFEKEMAEINELRKEVLACEAKKQALLKVIESRKSAIENTLVEELERVI